MISEPGILLESARLMLLSELLSLLSKGSGWRGDCLLP